VAMQKLLKKEELKKWASVWMIKTMGTSMPAWKKEERRKRKGWIR
jgi:hypothetical protein